MAAEPGRAPRPWWALVAALLVLAVTAVAAILVWRVPESGRAERVRERAATAAVAAEARRPWFTDARAQMEQVAADVASRVGDVSRLRDDVLSPADLAALAAPARLLDSGVFLVDTTGRVVA